VPASARNARQRRLRRFLGVSALGNVRKVRAFKVKRWNGVTQGKNTWADAEALMEPVAVRELSALYTSTVVDEFVRPL
jgi:hypothetical protein